MQGRQSVKREWSVGASRVEVQMLIREMYGRLQPGVLLRDDWL